MLKKNLRLDRKALEAFFKKKTGYAAGNLVHARYIRNSLNRNRFGVAISFAAGQPQKGRAVLRNLTKRRTLEAVSLLLKDAGSGLDMVFFVKIKGKQAPKFTELKKDIIYVLHSTHISRSIL
ncbi:MAG: ribonuclease P protein component [bacterium]|nr:ribonuclease P protein component [bacterium]